MQYWSCIYTKYILYDIKFLMTSSWQINHEICKSFFLFWKFLFIDITHAFMHTEIFWCRIFSIYVKLRDQVIVKDTLTDMINFQNEILETKVKFIEKEESEISYIISFVIELLLSFSCFSVLLAEPFY